MDETLWTAMTIVGPAILVVAILWVAVRSRRNGPDEVERSEKATHDLYDEEEVRRREGTDGL